MLFERPWIAGKRTWRSLETENLKLAKEELHRRKAGVKKPAKKGTPVVVTCGDVIRRYQKDKYPDNQRQKRPARSHELEERHCLTLLLFWDEIPVDDVTNGTCDRFCDLRGKLVEEAREAAKMEREKGTKNQEITNQPVKSVDENREEETTKRSADADGEEETTKRDGTRAVDLDLNTLSNGFNWGVRVEVVTVNPVAKTLRPIILNRKFGTVAKPCLTTLMKCTNSVLYSSTGVPTPQGWAGRH